MSFKKDLLKGKIALVSGGRSGIGYEISKMFLQLGAKVIICSRKEEPLKMACEELSEYGECVYKTVDIRTSEEVDALFDFIHEKFGKLDILVNNAGGQFPSSTEKISDNGWASVINNNLNGTFFMTRRSGTRFFIPQKSGVILNMTANVSRGFPGMAHTGVARAGVENLTKTLASEWGEYNIRINSLSLGVIKSSGLSNYPDSVQELIDSEIIKSTPLGRLGSTEDVAKAAVFLTSDLSSFITGANIPLDGGQSLAGDIMNLPKILKNFDSKNTNN